MNPDLLRLQAETRCDLVAVDMQPLRRDVDVDAAFAVRHAKTGLGAQERLILDADLVHARHRHVAGCFWIAVSDDERANDVRSRVVPVAVAHRVGIWMQGLLLGRSLGVGYRRQRLVLDAIELGCATSLLW